jgi:RNase adaptor protein for sRNA GlmZ degradation
MLNIRVISFGFGHGEPPRADVLLDVRETLRNPHDDPQLREMTGLDSPVRAHVLATPGALTLLRHVTDTALALADALPNGEVTVAWGCSGGRHRAVALADELHRMVWEAGADVAEVEHRDVDKPLLALAGRQA